MRRNFTLWHGFAASILIHGCLVLSFVAVLHLPHMKKTHTLKVELQGMVSDRQLAQKKAVQQQQPQPAAPPPEERKDVPKPEVKKIVKEALARPVPRKPSPQAAVSPPPPPVQETPAAVTQTQQTIRHVDEEEEAFKAYLRNLKRKLQTNLIYPESAKSLGFRGVAVVAFTVTESGEIADGSLRIVRSSGFPELDVNALATARSSAPFERPSKDLPIVVAVAFEVKN